MSVLGRARCRVREESAQEAATLSPSTARLARVIAEEVVRVHRGSKGDNSALPSGKQPQPIAATGSGEPPGTACWTGLGSHYEGRDPCGL